MSTSTIQLPANFTANVVAVSSDTLGNLSPYIVLIIGVLLGVLVVGALISFLHR